MYIRYKSAIRLFIPFVFLLPSLGCANPEIWQKDARPPCQGDIKITEILVPILLKHQLPAIGAGILDNSGHLRIGVVGIRKAGQNTPVTPDDLWHLGSCTKAMHATLIARLVEEGKLRWDCTLAEVFPDRAASFKPDFASITLAHLLQHRSGLARDGDYPMLSKCGDVQQQRRQALLVAASGDLLHKPGETYLYSNLGYIVAGAVVETITGHSYENLMHEKVFEPLEMKSARFESPKTIQLEPVAFSHFENGRPIDSSYAAVSDPAVLRPAGCLRLTLQDWSQFIFHHLVGEVGRSDFLPAESYRTLHTSPAGFEYAFGWLKVQRDWGGGAVLNHTGSNTLNFANVWIAPQKGFAIFVCTNRSSFEATDEAVAALIPQALEADKPK